MLLDVTPRHLGIKSSGGTFTKLVEANTTVPVSAKKVFTTVTDEQTTVRIQVYQGMESAVNKNDFLADLILEDIPKAPMGEPEIEVSFKLDVNGILQVSAVDLSTGTGRKVVIESGNLSKEEIVNFQNQNQEYDRQIKRNDQPTGVSEKEKFNMDEVKKVFEEVKESFDSKIEGEIPSEMYMKFKNLLEEVSKKIDSGDDSVLEEVMKVLEKMRSQL